MAKSHKTVSSPIATKTKLNEPQIRQNDIAKPKPTKKQIGIICGVIAVLVAALVAILALVLNRSQPQTETLDVLENTQDEPVIDYHQKITSEDGGEFKAEYQAGSEKNFAMRFSDLKCEDNCKNVSEVKLGDKILKQGEDFEVKSGSIIIVLTENFMKSLKAGEFDLVIAVKGEDRTMLYGVKFTVKPEPTCGEGETLEKGECVKKPEEQPTQSQTGNTTTKPSNNKPATKPTQPSQPSAPSKSQAQIECESKTGPMRFFALHWTSKNEYTDAEFSGNIGMHWVNGVCRPNVSQATDLFGRGFATAGQPVSEYTNPLIVENMGQDIIVWFWSDGSSTIDKVTSAFDVWKY